LAEWTTRELLEIFALGLRLPTFPEPGVLMPTANEFDDVSMLRPVD
jgi:hypothetical protein